MEAVQNRLGKIKSNARGGADKKAAEEYAFLEKLYAHLEAEKPARTFPVQDTDEEFLKNLFLLTVKPVIYAANIKENDMGKDEESLPFVVEVKKFAAKEHSEVLVICAKTEEELSQMDPDDKARIHGGIRTRRKRTRPPHQKILCALGAHFLSDGGRKGNPGLDHRQGNEGSAGRGENPFRL